MPETYMDPYRDDCSYCGGNGEIRDDSVMLTMRGTGEPPMRPCPVCSGSGWVLAGEFELSEETEQQEREDNGRNQKSN